MIRNVRLFVALHVVVVLCLYGLAWAMGHAVLPEPIPPSPVQRLAAPGAEAAGLARQAAPVVPGDTPVADGPAAPWYVRSELDNPVREASTSLGDNSAADRWAQR